MNASSIATELRRRPWLAASLLGLLTLAVFLPTTACGFVNWDDDYYVYANPVVLGGLTTDGVRHALTDSFVSNWAPLTILSYQLDATVFGIRAWGFHLTSAVLHALAVALLYVALVRMTGSAGRSAAASLLFAVHPLRVESVAWVSERKDVLCVLFLALSLLAYDRYCRRPGPGRYAAVVAAMLGGLLAKSMLVTLPVLLLLADVWPLGRLRLPGVGQPGVGLTGAGQPTRGDREASPYPSAGLVRCLLEKVPLAALSVVFAGITLVTQTEAMREEESLPLVSARIPNAIHSLAWYAWKTLWPTGLCPFHRHAGTAMAWPVLAAGTLAVAAAAVVAVRSARRHPAVTWGLAWYAVSLVPVIGLVQVGSHGTAERYTYIPHVGLLVAAVWGLADAAAARGVSRRALAAATVVAATALVMLTGRQIATWKDSDTLWNHAIAIDPLNFVAHFTYGELLRERGDFAAAIRHYREALKKQDIPLVHNSLGLALVDAGSVEEGMEHYRRSLALDPNYMPTLNNVGLALLGAGRLDEAVERFEAVLALQPAHGDALHNLLLAQAARGDLPAAISAGRRLVVVRPDSAEARSRLGQLLLKEGRPEQAVEELRQAARIDPNYPGILQLLERARAMADRPSEAAAPEAVTPGRRSP